MSTSKQQFQTLLISGYARSINKETLHPVIVNTCILFYNNMSFHVDILSNAMSMNPEDIESKCHPQSWSNIDATTFNVRRGPNYVDGQKQSSKPSLYRIFHIDAYQTPFKMRKLWSYVHPNIAKDFEAQIQTHSVPQCEKEHALPPLLIINIMAPNYKPEMGKNGKCDGIGFQEVIYCHLSDNTTKKLQKFSKSTSAKKSPLSPSIKLFSQFTRNESLQKSRFKIIARCMNGKYTKLGFVVNKLIKTYNAKPFVAKTSTTYYYEEGKYFGIDIDIHSFGYAAKKGFDLVKDMLPTIIFDIGFVMEGCANNELPEQMLVAKRVSKLGLKDFCSPIAEEIVKKYKK